MNAHTVSLPTTMTAVEIPRPGGADALKLGRRPLPQPGAEEVLIEVHATSINRLDVFQREGIYPIPPGASDIPGLDVAGRIVAMGKDVVDWRVGDSVCALLSGGGYAEYCTASAGSCLPLPQGMSFAEAALLPETTFTAWSNVFDRGSLQSGETVLIHGGAGGVGTMAIQLAAQLGATVFTTAGDDEKCRRCVALGATKAINYKTENFVEAILKATDGKGVNVVLDMIGGDYLDRNLQALAIEGRLVQIALLGGAQATFNLAAVMLKRLTLTGSTLRARPAPFKAAIADNLRRRVWPLIEQGKIKPILAASYPLEDIVEAHHFFMSGANFGKVSVTVR